MPIEKDLFGTTDDGQPVDRFTLRNHTGAMAKLLSYGATVTELHMPDRHGNIEDVVLGFESVRPYETVSPYFGCLVGRTAFRIANGRFNLDGTDYQLTQNDGPHHLHGGHKGLNKVLWRAEPDERNNETSLRLIYNSPDGEEGYPGRLRVSARFTLSELNELVIDFTAESDRRTPVNLTHHGYFNLAGKGDILEHELFLAASRYTHADDNLVPTGESVPVDGTPFDFRKTIPIGARHEETGGYDLCYLLDDTSEQLTTAARLRDPQSGREVEVRTTAPAIVLYTGNYLDGTLAGKYDRIYQKHAALCLETGHPPDAINHAELPSIVAGPDQPYRQTCVYAFSAR